MIRFSVFSVSVPLSIILRIITFEVLGVIKLTLVLLALSELVLSLELSLVSGCSWLSFMLAIRSFSGLDTVAGGGAVDDIPER